MQIEQFILTNEPAIRLGFFLGFFFVMVAWELLAPQRTLKLSKLFRWTNNLGLAVLNTVLVRLLFPFAAVGMAAYCAKQDWGVLNQFAVPFWLAVPLAVVLMDFVIWLQHVMVHHVPVLWRLHRVHHADPDYDLTTGSRFHPIEIILSMLIKFVTIALVGAPVLAVVLFEIILNSVAMFNHGNVRLPVGLDSVLRWFIVTPDMHRVHHSVVVDETNSNYGFNLSCWDRLFGTYRAQPRAGQLGMTIGIDGFTNSSEIVRLDGMLLMPFRQKVPDTEPSKHSSL